MRPVSKHHYWIATLLPRNGSTGVHTYFNQLTNLLIEGGHDPQVLTPYPPHNLHMRATLAALRRLRALQPELAVRASRAVLGRSLFTRLGRASASSATSHVTLIAQDPLSAIVCHAWRTEANRNCKLVMICHFNKSERNEWILAGLDPNRWNAGGVLDLQERRALEAADRVVVPSQWLTEELLGRYPKLARKVSTIHNWVDATSAGPRAAPEFDLLSVGSLVPLKNHDYLIDIVIDARNRGRILRAAIAGEGPERARLQARVQALGLGANFQLLGRRDDVRSLLASAAVFVHTSAAENMPLAVIEAASAGLPIAVTPSLGAAEVIRNELDGIHIPFGDPTTAATMLLTVIDNEARRRELSIRARARFDSMFSREATTAKLLEVISVSE